MSWLRTFLLFRILQNSKETEIAKRDQSGAPICGGCQTHVDPQATKCTGCGSSLYTRRGKMARNLFSVFGVLMILGGVMGDSAMALLAVIPGALCLYIWWSLRTDAPNRELNLMGRLPFVSGQRRGEKAHEEQHKQEREANPEPERRYQTEGRSHQHPHTED